MQHPNINRHTGIKPRSASGAAAGEAAANIIAAELYPGKKIDELTSEQKGNISALSTMAAGLAGGLASSSSNGVAVGADAGKTAVENNALSVAENKSRSEEFVHCQGNAGCENGVNEKYKKISAEQHESVVNCQGAQDCVDKANEVGKLQADYANRANDLKEYARVHGSLTPEEQNELSILEGTSIQLEADRTEAIHRATMSGDSPEAKKLAIDALAQAVGTSAAGIAAGVGKGKTVDEGVTPPVPLAKVDSNTSKKTSETYFRVEGGGTGTQTSQNRINVNSDGSVTINSGCSGQLCVSTNGPNHAAYYLTNRRQDGSVVVFEVDAALHKQIMDAAISQRPVPGMPRDPNAPKKVDPGKGEPSVSLELPKVWDRLIEQNSSNARVLTKEEFMNEFGK